MVCARSSVLFCAKGVRYDPVPGALERAWSQHEAECSGKVAKTEQCPVAGCANPLTVGGSVICSGCRRRVCLQHRFEDLHPCRASRPAGAAAGVGMPPVSRLDWLNTLQGHSKAPPQKQVEALSTASVKSESTSSALSVPTGPVTSGALSAVTEALKHIDAVSEDAQEAFHQTLLKLLVNVVQNPQEAKFRRLNPSNKALAAKIFAVPGAVGVLRAMGWQQDSGEDGPFVLPAEVPIELVRTVTCQLRERLQALFTAKAASIPLVAAPIASSAVATVVSKQVPDEWSCPCCTLVNSGSDPVCDACGALRG